MYQENSLKIHPVRKKDHFGCHHSEYKPTHLCFLTSDIYTLFGENSPIPQQFKQFSLVTWLKVGGTILLRMKYIDYWYLQDFFSPNQINVYETWSFLPNMLKLHRLLLINDSSRSWSAVINSVVELNWLGRINWWIYSGHFLFVASTYVSSNESKMMFSVS